MKQMWAPWRMTYILQDKADCCFLCGSVQSDRDREHLLLHRGRTCAVILNRYPYNNGHLMVFPYRHVADLEALTPDERLETMDLLARATDLLKRLMCADGCNVGINLGRAAGAGLKEHLHVHVVPRWEGDTNFMPVIDDTRIIPQALGELYDRLAAAWDQAVG